MIHLRHGWVPFEWIGWIVTSRCRVCGKTRTRVGDGETGTAREGVQLRR